MLGLDNQIVGIKRRLVLLVGDRKTQVNFQNKRTKSCTESHGANLTTDKKVDVIERITFLQWR